MLLSHIIRLSVITFVVLFWSFLSLTHNASAFTDDVIHDRYAHYLGHNCVLWARSVEPRLPQGLFTQIQKNSLINTWKPHIGAIAVTAESYAGHLSIVRSIDETHVVVEEANYIPGFVTTRSVLHSDILGYVSFK